MNFSNQIYYLAHMLDECFDTDYLQPKVVFKKVPRDELVQLLDEIEIYNESKRFRREKFE